MSGIELDEEERYGLTMHFVTHVRLFENYFAQYNLGTMDEGDWQAQRELLKRLFGIDAYREAYLFLGGTWNAGFAVEVERILAETREATVQRDAAAEV